MGRKLEIDTHILTSIATGVVLGNISLEELLRIYSLLYGASLSIEQLTKTKIHNIVVDEAYRQFPNLPSEAEAKDNWESARNKAESFYGLTVLINSRQCYQ
jgi:hypothetical protein